MNNGPAIGAAPYKRVTITQAGSFLGIRLFQFGHLYWTDNLVCTDGSELSDAELAKFFKDFIVPSAWPQEAKNGDYFVVNDPTFGPFGGTGIVQTFVAPDGLSGRNVTTVIHPLHSGAEDRQLYRASDGSIGVRTFGDGGNRAHILALINAHGGVSIFTREEKKFARSLQSQFEQCKF